MKKIFTFTIIASLLLSCTPKNADEAKTGDAKKVKESTGEVYTLVINNSTIQWRGTKPSGEHVGTVQASKGTLSVEAGNISGGSFTIDLNTIVNSDLQGEWNEKLVGHLKSEDFFHTEVYPEAVFEIVSLAEFSGEAPAEGISPTHTVTGNLTMRGVTKSITFPASVTMSEGKVMAKTNEFSIDRTLWGVNFKSKTVFAEFKDDFIGDMINLTFDVEFAKE